MVRSEEIELKIQRLVRVGANVKGIDGAVDEVGRIGGVFGKSFAILFVKPAAVKVATFVAYEVTSLDWFFEGDAVESFVFEEGDVGIFVIPGG